MRPLRLLYGGAAVIALAATTVTTVTGPSVAQASPSSPPAGTKGGTGATTSTASRAESVHAAMTLDQRIGQLFMVATPADSASSALRTVVADQHVGNVILMGRSTAGADRTRAVTTAVQTMTEPTARTRGVPAFVSADQEGGNVQVLRGPGYSDMPTALVQGRSSDTALRTDAQRWGTQLSRSGVNTNLGPVLDVVSAQYKPINQPIGRYDREYGATPSVVTAKGGAVQSGMTRAGVATTVKHFPGLGRVRGNTDTSSGVTDTYTTTGSSIIDPFASAVRRGTPFVMMSSAIYSRIDASQPALFSGAVVTSLLRRQLGFDGVVMTDDVGNAAQLSGYPAGERATRFVDAGGDMVLTARTDTLPAMVAAVRSRASSSPAFRAKVDAAALRVLRAKEDAGLLQSRGTPSGNFTSWTVKRLQGWLGKTPTGTWDTATIRSVQYRIGTPTSGRWDARSFAALQRFLGISTDGTSTWDARTTTQLQRYLNTQL